MFAVFQPGELLAERPADFLAMGTGPQPVVGPGRPDIVNDCDPGFTTNGLPEAFGNGVQGRLDL